MTEKEKSYAGILYQPGDAELAADRDETVKKYMSTISYTRWIVRPDVKPLEKSSEKLEKIVW